jgi:hypothetical protein
LLVLNKNINNFDIIQIYLNNVSNNLNDNLYKRFGLEFPVQKVQVGFTHYVKNLINDKLGLISHPRLFPETDKLYQIQRTILIEACREMFFDFDEYKDWDYGFGWFLRDLFDTDFTNLLVRLQILVNIVNLQPYIRTELIQFVQDIEKYLQDYPILGLTIKSYKKRSPQFLPMTSKTFEKVIKDTLGILDNSTGYTAVVSNYEDGLKEFLTANSNAQLKDVVEDMYTSLDTLIQIKMGDKKLGLRNIFVGKEPLNFGLNKWQLNIFGEMMDWMNKIKHGSEKDFEKTHIEMIILLVSELIKTIINKKSE